MSLQIEVECRAVECIFHRKGECCFSKIVIKANGKCQGYFTQRMLELEQLRNEFEKKENERR